MMHSKIYRVGFRSNQDQKRKSADEAKTAELQKKDLGAPS
jgi:hypothetical protein